MVYGAIGCDWIQGRSTYSVLFTYDRGMIFRLRVYRCDLMEKKEARLGSAIWRVCLPAYSRCVRLSSRLMDWEEGHKEERWPVSEFVGKL